MMIGPAQSLRFLAGRDLPPGRRDPAAV